MRALPAPAVRESNLASVVKVAPGFEKHRQVGGASLALAGSAACNRDSLTQTSRACSRSSANRRALATPPKTPLGKGLGYLDRQWPRLRLFLEDGNIEATNNPLRASFMNGLRYA